MVTVSFADGQARLLYDPDAINGTAPRCRD